MSAQRYTDNEIRRRAYELWEQRGRPEGYEAEFWAQAERDLISQANGGRTSANDPQLMSGAGSGPSR